MSEDRNIPELRFPDFRETWKKVKLSSVVKVNQGLAILRKNRFDISGPNRYKYITIPFLLGGKCQYIENPSNSVTCEFDDIIVTRTGSGVGQIWTGVSGVFHNNFFKVVPIENKIIKSFLYHFLNNKSIQVLMQRYAGVGAIPDLNHGEFYILPYYQTSLPEQQKIADFLSTVDQRIQALTRKKELLEHYKKGVMQKIFPKKGEKIPEVRFKKEDGSEYDEWEERTLKEVSISYYQGINTAADSIIYSDKGLSIIQAKHITNEVIDFDNVRFVSDELYRKYKDKYQPKINDILISNIGTLGKVVLVENQEPFLIAWNIFKITLCPGINPRFITYSVKQKALRGYFERMKTGNATKFVNKTDLLKMKIELPIDEEQTRIENFLFLIDSKIDQVNHQLDKWGKWKKGLLQKMFV